MKGASLEKVDEFAKLGFDMSFQKLVGKSYDSCTQIH